MAMRRPGAGAGAAPLALDGDRGRGGGQADRAAQLQRVAPGQATPVGGGDLGRRLLQRLREWRTGHG